MCESNTSSLVRQWLYTAPKFLCLMTTILLVTLLFTLVSRDTLFDNDLSVIVSDIFVNVHQQPINQIAVAQGSDCPPDYSKVSLGLWGGTYPGCYCNGHFLNHSCPQVTPSCYNLQGIPAKSIETWDQKSFCVQNTTSLFYNTEGTDCPEGTKQCSSNSCIDSAEDCPILDIDIITTDEATPENYTEVYIDDSTRLIYTRNSSQSGEFINSLQVSFYDYPCFDPSLSPGPRHKNPYPLARIPEEGCSPHGQHEYLDNINELPMRSVLADNGINLSEIKDHGTFKNHTTGEAAFLIGTRRYTMVDRPECLAIDSELMSKLQEYEAEFVDSLWSVAILAGIITLALIVTLPLEVFLRIKDREEQKIMLKLIAYLNIGALCALYFLYLVAGFIAVQSQLQFNTETSYLKGFRRFECFKQEEANRLLSQLVRVISDDVFVLLALNMTLSALSFVGLVLLVTLTVTDIYQVRKEKVGIVMTTSSQQKRKKNKNHKKGEMEMLLKNQH